MLDGLSVAAVVAGAVSLIFGVHAFDGSGAISGVHSDGSFWLLIAGSLATIGGIAGLLVSSRSVRRPVH